MNKLFNIPTVLAGCRQGPPTCSLMRRSRHSRILLPIPEGEDVPSPVNRLGETSAGVSCRLMPGPPCKMSASSGQEKNNKNNNETAC